jgi:hypothetical protein
MVGGMHIIYSQANAMRMSMYEHTDQMQALRGLLLHGDCSSACKRCLVGAQNNEGVLCSCIAHTTVHQT